MDTNTMLEVFGWIGSLMVVASLVLSNQLRFRWYNMVGSFIAATYNAIFSIWPFVVMNGAIVLIDLYWIIRLRRVARERGGVITAEEMVTDSNVVR